jgi:hypothetical protein
MNGREGGGHEMSSMRSIIVSSHTALNWPLNHYSNFIEMYI